MRPSLPLLAAAAAALVAAALLVTGCPSRAPDAQPRTPSEPTVSPEPTVTPDPGGEETQGRPLKVYMLRSGKKGSIDGEFVAPVRRFAGSQSVAADALRALLAGPSAEEREAGYVSAIPEGTELLGVSVSDGVAMVDVSGGFAGGGGSASMRGRVAQIVFTATQFQEIEAVRLRVDGRDVTELGGEGLLLEGPQTRADWEDLTPAVLIEEPVFGDPLDSPLAVSGTANVFEATFQLEVEVKTTSDGSTSTSRSRQTVTASSGSGSRGTFDSTLTFDTAGEGTVSVNAYYESAEDGSRVDVFSLSGPVR